MNEIRSILQACQEAEGQPLALATVVKVAGSVYRRPGARMLIHADGQRIGAISGGCLEADVALRAQQVIATGEPAYVLYDTRVADGDVVFELGCKGAVGILIERADAPIVRRSLEFLTSFIQERGQGVMATVFRVEGDCPAQVGERLMHRAQEVEKGSLATGCLAAALQQECARVMQSGHPLTRAIPFPSGRAEALIEPVQSPNSLLVCGAGQDAIPLVRMAQLLGWQVTILDYRSSLLTPERFPGAETVLITGQERLPASCVPDARTAIVLMTHSYVHDLLWLQHLLSHPCAYVGLLGPRKRAEQLRDELLRDGVALDAAWLARLHSPVGLDIGAETSEEIALAVLAEIQAVLNNRKGGFLRERQGPIHSASFSSEADHRDRSFQVTLCPLSA